MRVIYRLQSRRMLITPIRSERRQTNTIMKEIRTKQTRKYIIRRAFDEYQPGDEFIPTGHRNDKVIIEHYCDIVYTVDADKKSRKREE